MIRVFDDIEKGKLRDIDFLECNACWGGCCNGNLTVDNVYVSQAKLQSLMPDLPDTDPVTEAEVARRYPIEDFATGRAFQPRERVVVGDLRERVDGSRRPAHRRVAAGLGLRPVRRPHVRGARPRCRHRRGRQDDCVFVSSRRLDELRRDRGGRQGDHR